MLISWSEKVKQGMGHPSIFSRFVYRYLHDLRGKNPRDRHTCIFTGIDVKIACELNLHGSILVCKNPTRVNGKFFSLGMRLHPEKNLD